MSEISERRKKIAIRVAITETCMAIIIVLLVIFFALLSLGYNFNFAGGVEHTGLLQVSSTPSATLTIDDDTLLFPTTQSKTLVSGPHEIKLQKDGFSSWNKTISVIEGLYYRLTYPRLYLLEREKKTIPLISSDKKDTPEEESTPVLASISKDYKFMLTISEDKTWHLVNLNDSSVSTITLPDSLAASSYRVIEWADSGTRVLVRATTDSVSSWLLIDLNNPEKSIDLTASLALNFSDIKIMNSSASELWALADGQLRFINADALEISKILAKNVTSFTSFGAEVAYATTSDTGRHIYLYQSGAEKSIPIKDLEDLDSPLYLALSHYYDDDYLSILLGSSLSIYSGTFPVNGDKFSKKMSLLTEQNLSFTPDSLRVRGSGELIVVSQGTELAIFDAESFKTSSVTLESNPIWLSDFDLASVSADAWLTTHDFDGANPFAIASPVSLTLPATISENDKYIYYFNDNLELTRETIK